MAKAVGLYDPPQCKRGMPEYPKFIRRTVRVKYGRISIWKAEWLCKCGNVYEAYVTSVANRHSKTCGCTRRSKEHGHSIGGKKSPTYVTWQSMITRCTNENHEQYHHYAGSGIKVCEQWLNSFGQFLSDVGERPKGTTLDRIDPYGNYEPSNVRWADPITQRHNRRDRKLKSA